MCISFGAALHDGVPTKRDNIVRRSSGPARPVGAGRAVAVLADYSPLEPVQPDRRYVCRLRDGRQGGTPQGKRGGTACIVPGAMWADESRARFGDHPHPYPKPRMFGHGRIGSVRIRFSP